MPNYKLEFRLTIKHPDSTSEGTFSSEVFPFPNTVHVGEEIPHNSRGWRESETIDKIEHNFREGYSALVMKRRGETPYETYEKAGQDFLEEMRQKYENILKAITHYHKLK